MSGTKSTLSIIMPALNEEANIRDAVAEAIAAVGDRFSDYEILLFDDGSRDRTGALMDELARGNPRIRVTHNPTPRNLGVVYRQGVDMARYEHVVMIPGDNENPSAAMQAPFEAVGSADMVVPYPETAQARSWARKLLSRTYVALLNWLAGRRLRYYNGTVIHRTENLRRLGSWTQSFAYQSEILLKLLAAGKTCREVPIEVAPKPGRRSKAFRPKNVLLVVGTLARLTVAMRLRRPADVEVHAP